MKLLLFRELRRFTGDEISVTDGKNGKGEISVGKPGKSHTFFEGDMKKSGKGEFNGEVYRGGEYKIDLEQAEGQEKSEEEKNKEEDKDKKRNLIIPVLIPLVLGSILINLPQSCIGNTIPDEEPSISDTSIPEPSYPEQPDNNQDPKNPISNWPDPILPPININTEQIMPEIVSMAENFRAMLTCNRRDNFSNSDYIVYDLRFMNGKTIEDVLGKEFAGTSTSDGMPSSFHSKLESKYMVKEDVLELVKNINTSQNILLMNESELNNEIKNINATRKQNNQPEINIDSKSKEEFIKKAKMELIKNKLGYNLKTVDGCKNLLEMYQIYGQLQLESSIENEALLAEHEKTTHESLNVRQGEANDSYKREEEGLDVSIEERKNMERQDQIQLDKVIEVITKLNHLKLLQNLTVSPSIQKPPYQYSLNNTNISSNAFRIYGKFRTR